MQPETAPAQSAIPQYEDLSRALEYTLLDAALSSDEIADKARQARNARLGAVLVWPSCVDGVVRALEGHGTKAGAVIGYPYGAGTTGSKLFEGRDALRRGAALIEFTLNLPYMRARNFQHVETEVLQMSNSCAESGAEFRVVLETSQIDIDLLHIGFRIAKRVRAARFSTGHLGAASSAQMGLLLEHKGFRIELKSGVTTGDLPEILRAQQAGVSRFGVSDPWDLIVAWRAHLDSLKKNASTSS